MGRRVHSSQPPPRRQRRRVVPVPGTRREPYNFTPVGVNPVSSGSPHVRPMGRTRGEPDEIKKNAHPKHFTALFREQGSRDADFGVSIHGCVWPRAAIAAGTWWGFNTHTKDLDEATFNATSSRLASRGIPSCPCSTLTTNGCNQEQRCGKAYCP